MADCDSTGIRMNRSSLSVTLALILALTMCGAVFLVARMARTAAVADETMAPIGPVCFYQNGYPTCVERSDLNISVTPDVMLPEVSLTVLLAGPTPEERDRGIETALPPGTQLISVLADDVSITVRLAFPDGFLDLNHRPPTADGRPLTAFSALTSEAIIDQVFRTLFPLGYRDIQVEAQDPSVLGDFRPLSAYLPPVTVPSKEKPASASAPGADGSLLASRRAGQPPVDVTGRPLGALSGKTIYVSAGHGWQWNGSNWRTQRPPYPDATTGYSGPIIEDHNNAEVVNQYLLRYLWNAGADVWTARERDLNLFEQIIDNDAAGFRASGAWETVGTSGYLTRYLKTTTELMATAAVTWTTNPQPADGVYGLYVWYVPGPDRTPSAHYTVYHAGEATELTIDQRHHGYTWRYVGRFPVRAGERLTVSLDNRSTTPGQVVVADAVRLGGGQFDDTDLAINGGSVDTSAPYAPDKPWWEVAAFYQVQRQGVDPDDFAYFNDVVARPFWARWEHANTGDDALYVSWHTNGFNGHNTTVWGTVSFIQIRNQDTQPVTGSAELRHAIHSELINDIRAGWDPAWRDLGAASRDLGELRELWDDNASNAIPGVLLEIAYHDHVSDTNALKDPRFALLSARAVYQGIVKYFAARDGIDLALLPEPPTHLIVRNAGTGQVTVSWRPSFTDGVGLVGDTAESYRVYTSHDGLGWDDGRPVIETQTTLTGLQENELIFVRVTAVNVGGESFPTPVLAARASPDGSGRVLVVDGFDRIDRHGLIVEDDPTEGLNARLFPDQINSYDYVIRHGQHISLPFDSAVNEAVADGDLDLLNYQVVDWILGEESTVDHTFTPIEQAAVATFLSSGRGLFVSGAEIGWDLVERGNDTDADFYRTYLGADMAGDDADTYLVTPTADGIFAGLGPIAFRDNYDADYADRLAPRNGSVAALEYLGGAGGTAAIQYDAGNCRRVVYLGFPFETIASTDQAAVMERVLGYLRAGGCLTLPPQTVITTPVSGQAFNIVPDFVGTASGEYPVERVEVQISHPDGRYWDGHDWITTSRWLTATGTTVWHYPLPPAALAQTSLITSLDQGEYSLWARARDTAGLIDPMPAFASFIYDSISPTTPTLLAPANGITVTLVPTGFFWRGPLSDTGSTLGYNLQVDSRVLTQSTTSYIPSGWFAKDTHTWRVRAFDAAGNRSPWTDFWTFVVEGYDAFIPLIYRGSGHASMRAPYTLNEGSKAGENWEQSK
jgi:N-acetylmuramoyl-L-alanine amidase